MDDFDDGGFGFNTDKTPLVDYTHDDNINLGNTAETSFSNPSGGAERPIDSLYDTSTRDGSTFDTTADVYSTDGTSVDTTADVHISSGTSFINLPNPPRITPSSRPGDNIGKLWGKLADSELAAAKKALVNEYYQSIAKNYEGLPLPKKIPYDQFKVSRNGKTLYWTPEEGKVISIISKRGGGFLALSTLASKYGNGGIEAIRNSMGLNDYMKTQKNRETQPQAYDNILPAEDADITPALVDHTLASAEIATKALDEELTPEQSAALGTINDPPLDLQWVTPARMKLRDLSSEMTRMRDSLVNNEAKLSELEEHLAKERRKLEEAPDEAIKNRIAERIKGLEDEIASRREIASATRKALRSQISRIRETLHRILHEDKTLAERIKTLFREQGITIASILTAIGMTISTLVLALTGGSGSGAAPPQPTPPQPPDKGGIKEWLKKQPRSLGRILAKLADKAAAALPELSGQSSPGSCPSSGRPRSGWLEICGPFFWLSGAYCLWRHASGFYPRNQRRPRPMAIIPTMRAVFSSSWASWSALASATGLGTWCGFSVVSDSETAPFGLTSPFSPVSFAASGGAVSSFRSLFQPRWYALVAIMILLL